jgi:hypothetical protein
MALLMLQLFVPVVLVVLVVLVVVLLLLLLLVLVLVLHPLIIRFFFQPLPLSRIAPTFIASLTVDRSSWALTGPPISSALASSSSVSSSTLPLFPCTHRCIAFASALVLHLIPVSAALTRLS